MTAVYFVHGTRLRFRSAMPASDLLKHVPYRQVSEPVRSHVVIAWDSDAWSSVFLLVWSLGGAYPCLNLLVVEWLMFLKVKKERLFKSHANHFESQVTKEGYLKVMLSILNLVHLWFQPSPKQYKVCRDPAVGQIVDKTRSTLGRKCRVGLNIWYIYIFNVSDFFK